MKTYQEVMQAHQELLTRYEQGERGEALVQAALAYIEAARQAAEHIAAPRDRDQLRANLRFWAAFVFERTGTYPDTTLLPARAVSSPGAAQGGGEVTRGALSQPPSSSLPLSSLLETPVAKGAVSARPPTAWFWPALVVIGLLALISIVSLGWQAWRGASARPTPTSPSSLVTPSKPTVTPTPQVTPGGPTLTPTPTTTPEPPTPTPTSTPTPVLMRQLALSGFNVQPAASCAQRLLTVALPAQSQALQSATLHVIPNVNDVPTKIVSIGKLQSAAVFDLTKEAFTLGETSYLVGVDAPGLPVVQALVPFTADCQYNQSELKFDYIAAPVLMEAPPRDEALTLNWKAPAWGLTPDGKRWTVELRLTATGGSGGYIYWLDGERLEGDTLWLEESLCQPARHLLGVSSGTRMTVRELVLYAPSLCSAP